MLLFMFQVWLKCLSHVASLYSRLVEKPTGRHRGESHTIILFGRNKTHDPFFKRVYVPAMMMKDFVRRANDSRVATVHVPKGYGDTIPHTCVFYTLYLESAGPEEANLGNRPDVGSTLILGRHRPPVDRTVRLSSGWRMLVECRLEIWYYWTIPPVPECGHSNWSVRSSTFSTGACH
jgi:hypothetical protein